MQKLNKYKESIGIDLYAEVRDVLDVYIWDIYDFLHISDEQWEAVACDIIDYILKKEFDIHNFIGNFRGKLNGVIRSFLLKNIKEQNAVVFDNLIIKLEHQGLKKEMVVLVFLRELEILNVPFNESTYAFLIQKSLCFKKIVFSLNLNDYKSFKKYFAKEKSLEHPKAKVVTKRIPAEQSKTQVATKKTRKKRTLISENENQELKLRETPKKAKNLYDRFEERSYVTQAEKELIINYLISLLSPYKAKLVKYCCQGLLYPNERIIANGIIGSVKIQYIQFLSFGWLSVDNEDLQNLRKIILERKNRDVLGRNVEIEQPDTFDYFGTLNLKFDSKNMEILKLQFEELEERFLEKGFSRKEFYKRVQEIIEIMKYFPATSEEDYISKLIEMIYSEINFPNRA